MIVGFRDRLPSDSSSSPTSCRQPVELDLYHFSSALLPHTTSVTPPSSPPSDSDNFTASSLSAPLRPPHRQLLHISLSPSSAENTPYLPLQCKISRYTQEEVRHLHLHSGQKHRHHAADGDLAAPCWRRGQDRRPCSAWVLGPLLPPLCRGVRHKRRRHLYHFVLSCSAPLL